MIDDDEKNRIYIFDTTLRDGEQSPGATMTLEQKVEIASLLDEMRVDVVEAGFPAASNGDFQAVQEIAKLTRNAIVCGLARAKRSDISRAAEALKPADRMRIHTFIATSPIHMKYKLQMEPDDVLAAVADSVGFARQYSDDVEWSCEDGTRSDADFLCRCFEAAIKAGATTVNIADTVGFALPHEFQALIDDLFERVAGIADVRFSVHCHDDLGLATANSLAAINSGARQVECTVNGLGERAGNASLEEIVMGLKTRNDAMPFSTKINTELLTRASRLVSGITGFVVPPNKAIVGSNAFAHESGIHQHGVIMNRGTYEIIDADAVGATGAQLIMGKHSGRHAFRLKLEELGFKLGENAVQEVFDRFKNYSDSRKEVTDEEIVDIVHDALTVETDRFRLERLQVSSEADGPFTVQIKISVNTELVSGTATASVVFEAIASAIASICPYQGDVEFVRVNTLADGTHPRTKVTLRLAGRDLPPAIGQGSASDQNIAYARALLNALNRQKVRVNTGGEELSAG